MGAPPVRVSSRWGASKQVSAPSLPSPTHAAWQRSGGGQAATTLNSNPNTRSPTAVASGSARVTAPPTANPPIWEKGGVMDSTRPYKQVMTWSGRLGAAATSSRSASHAPPVALSLSARSQGASQPVGDGTVGHGIGRREVLHSLDDPVDLTKRDAALPPAPELIDGGVDPT